MANNNNMLQICRLCLVKDDVNIPIFEDQGDIRQIFLKISSCLPVKVAREDRLPKKICDGCSYKLDMLYEFWNTSANAEKQLLSWLGEAGVPSKMADGALTAVAQQMKPAEAFVKEETLELPDGHADDDDKEYLFAQQKVEESASAGPSATVTSNEDEEPPPKRARRTAAVKAAIAMDQESDDDDDSGEPLTKIEDESEDSDGEDHVPAFVDVPSTSADDQPGPSGVGKDGVEAPSEYEMDTDDYDGIQCGICSNIFSDRQSFDQHSMPSGNQFICCNCEAAFETSDELYEHYDTHNNPTEETVYDEEKLLLNYDDSEHLLVQPVSDELLYILEDSTGMNEVTIGENKTASVTTSRRTKNYVEIEHGYGMTGNTDDDDEDPSVKEISRVARAQEKVTTPKRNSQPKKHAVPDFSPTTYEYREANSEIDMPHYKCVRCEQIFINKFGFSMHIEKGKCFVNNCDACFDTFRSNAEFVDHYHLKHPDRAICNFCFRTFMYEKNVKEHMLRHLDQFRHRCENCNKGFYTVREYRNHYKNRHMGIRHKCEYCGRTFADEYYFKRHIAAHSKVTSIYRIGE